MEYQVTFDRTLRGIPEDGIVSQEENRDRNPTGTRERGISPLE